MGLFTMGAHLFLPQSSKGDLGPRHTTTTTGFAGKPLGCQRLRGTTMSLPCSLLSRPNTFHGSLPLPCDGLSSTLPTSFPRSAYHGGDPPAAGRERASQTPAGRGNTASSQTLHPHSHHSLSHPSRFLRRPPASPGGERQTGTTGHGPASATPTPEKKAGSRPGRTNGRGTHAQ